MATGFDSFDVPDERTIDPRLLAQAGNGDSLSTSMQLESFESPLGNDWAFDHYSLLATAPWSRTEFMPDERAAVCADFSTVGHEYPDGEKIA